MAAEPEPGLGGEAAHVAAYLAYYRETVIESVLGLGAEEQRRARLPSGWSPIELLSHLLHMEQRWFIWGFLAEDVEAPWGDWTVDEPWREEAGPEARWSVAPNVTAQRLAWRLRELGERTGALLQTRDLGDRAKSGGRFCEEPPDLRWICFHVLHEYAVHTGHLQIAVEVAGDSAGSDASPRRK